jgi:hypothetical protein
MRGFGILPMFVLPIRAVQILGAEGSTTITLKSSCVSDSEIIAKVLLSACPRRVTSLMITIEMLATSAASLGGGLHSGVDSGGYQGLTANFEVGRQFSNLPTLPHGWRESVAVNMQF